MTSATATGRLAQNCSALAGSQTGWVGATFGAFEQLRESWEEADTARAKRLDDLATNLRRSAALYQFSDDASANDIDTSL